MVINQDGKTAFDIKPNEKNKPFFINEDVKRNFNVNQATVDDLISICRNADNQGRMVEIFIGESYPVYTGYGNDLLKVLSENAVYNIRYTDEGAYEPMGWGCYRTVQTFYLEELCQDFLGALWDSEAYEPIYTIDYLKAIRYTDYEDLIAIPNRNEKGNYYLRVTRNGGHVKACVGRPGEKSENNAGNDFNVHGHSGHTFTVVFVPIGQKATFTDYKNRLFWPSSYIEPTDGGAIATPAKGATSLHTTSNDFSHMYYIPRIKNTVKGVGDFVVGGLGMQNLIKNNDAHADDCIMKRPIFWNELDAVDDRIWDIKRPIGTLMTNRTVRIFKDPNTWVTANVDEIPETETIFFPVIYCLNRNNLLKKMGANAQGAHEYNIFGMHAKLVIPEAEEDSIQDTIFNIATKPIQRMV